MKKLLIILFCLPMIGFGQNLNIYKYIVIKSCNSSMVFLKDKGLRSRVTSSLQKVNYTVINYEDVSNYKDLEEKPELGLYCYIMAEESLLGALLVMSLKDSEGQLIWQNSSSASSFYMTLKKLIIPLKANFYEYDPNLVHSTKPNLRNNTQWKWNGSGFFISKSGYIVTNNHVIDGASEIEVEFKYNNEVEGFNAKIVKVDKTNDLAIIKIDDSEFSNLSDIPYNFKTRSSDVGTEVFALGYPMALTIMGKDIKFTDGKISSKTGFGGDITTYQIQVPIQPGNSGGPLFDIKGNLIGIASSGVNRKLDITENVNYAIKSSYLLNLIDVLPESIELPSSKELASKPLTEQIKVLSDYVVLIKVK